MLGLESLGLLEPGLGARLDKAEMKVLTVNEELNGKEIQKGSSESVYLYLSKTINVNDTEDLTYNNIAEVLEYSTNTGRRNYAGIPGNLMTNRPANGYEGEEDIDKARVSITNPRGGKSIYNTFLQKILLMKK